MLKYYFRGISLIIPKQCQIASKITKTRINTEKLILVHTMAKKNKIKNIFLGFAMLLNSIIYDIINGPLLWVFFSSTSYKYIKFLLVFYLVLIKIKLSIILEQVLQRIIFKG